MQNGEIKGAVEIAKDVTKLERLIRRTCTGKNRTATRLTAFSATARSFGKSSKTRNGQPVRHRPFFWRDGNGQGTVRPKHSQRQPALRRPVHLTKLRRPAGQSGRKYFIRHEKGAFTGAIDQPGLFEQAQGGTLLLDEINSLNLSLQAKLLRALQEKKIRRIGSAQDKPIDVRIIATMNEDPITAISEERLRKDLYYRLSVVTLIIPRSGSARRIFCLLEVFIQKNNHLFQMHVDSISDDVQRFFLEYDLGQHSRA